MGEKLEKYKFDQSTAVYIPAGLTHCLVKANVNPPFIFVECADSARHQETDAYSTLTMDVVESRGPGNIRKGTGYGQQVFIRGVDHRRIRRVGSGKSCPVRPVMA